MSQEKPPWRGPPKAAGPVWAPAPCLAAFLQPSMVTAGGEQGPVHLVVFLFLFHVDTQLCTWIGFGQVSPSFRMGKGFC